jgi:hypothetical protein
MEAKTTLSNPGWYGTLAGKTGTEIVTRWPAFKAEMRAAHLRQGLAAFPDRAIVRF